MVDFRMSMVNCRIVGRFGVERSMRCRGSRTLEEIICHQCRTPLGERIIEAAFQTPSQEEVISSRIELKLLHSVKKQVESLLLVNDVPDIGYENDCESEYYEALDEICWNSNVSEDYLPAQDYPSSEESSDSSGLNANNRFLKELKEKRARRIRANYHEGEQPSKGIWVQCDIVCKCWFHRNYAIPTPNPTKWRFKCVRCRNLSAPLDPDFRGE